MMKWFRAIRDWWRTTKPNLCPAFQETLGSRRRACILPAGHTGMHLGVDGVEWASMSNDDLL